MANKTIGLRLDQVKIGVAVLYYSWIVNEDTHSDPKESVITSESWMCCGELVCKIEGTSGGVCISHLVLK